MNNERGLITVDFMFSLVLILGFTTLMFITTITLSMASVTQYVTFAAARLYFAGGLDANQQVSLANAKYQELVEHPTFKPLFTNGWYEIDKEPTVGDHLQKFDYYTEAANGVNQFWGVGTSFTAHVLDINIPFFGTTNPEGEEGGFKTYLGSYLGREPTSSECMEFTNERWKQIRTLAVSGGAAYSTGTSASGYIPMTDDGC